MQQESRVQLAIREITVIKQSLSSKKKYIPMREALNKFNQLLEENKKKGIEDIPRDEIQKLLVPAQGQLRSAKFHISLICFLIKLINLKVINDIKTSEDVLDYLLRIKEIQKDELHFKLIQSFMTFIHSDFINFVNLGFAEKCLSLVLYMKNSKIPIISSSAETSLYKVIELLSASTQLIIAGQGFGDDMNVVIDLEDQQQEQQQQQQNSIPLDHQKQIQNLGQMLSDLIKISDYVKPHWFPSNVPLDREFGLASINSFLTNMGKFFTQYKNIQDLLCNNLMNVIKKILTTPSNMIKNSIVIEAYKCMIFLNDDTSSTEIWSIITTQIKQGEHSVQKNLAYQSLIYFVQSQIFLEQMLIIPLNENNYLLEVVGLLSNIAKDIPEPNENELKKWIELTSPTINLQQNCEVYPSDNALVCRMVSEFQCRFANSVCVYADQHKIQLGNQIKIPQSDQLYQIVDNIWKQSLRTLKYLLLKELDEQTLQTILSAFQTYINLIGSLQMRTAQTAFIKTICEFCKPSNNSEFAKKHIQINKMVLNIANCLGNLLECSSWVCIFKTFEECENHYLRNRLAKNSSQEEQNKTLDISILFQNLDQLFSESSQYGNEHLIAVMDAINQITIECLEVQLIDQKKQNLQFGETKKYFSLSKLLELIKFNVFRLDVFWELIIAHFISVVSAKNTAVVLNATDTLSQIIFYGFDYLTQFYKKSQNSQDHFIKEKWSKEECMYQQTLFQPWIDMCALRMNDMKEIILSNILKMLQNNGHEIAQKGWDSILYTLIDISAEQTTIFVKQGLSCAEYIINQFLSNLSGDQISKLFDVIDNFKSNSNEQNINFQICNMLWHLGDFITKNNPGGMKKITNQQLELYLPKIFYKLQMIAQDIVPEIRHSAIHIFSNLLIHLNCDNQYTEWKKILEDIFLELMHKICITFQDKNQAKEPDVAQWEETVKSIFQAFIKLIKKYFLIVEELSTSKEHDVEFIVKQVLPDVIIVFQQTKPQLTLEAAKQLRELFQYQSFICLQNLQGVLNQISEMYDSIGSDIKYLKTLILHITPEILELLNDIIKMTPDIMIQQVIDIYYKIIEFPLLAHLKLDLIQNKIFFEDNLAPKLIMQTLASTLSRQSKLLHQRLIINALNFIKEPPNDRFRYILIKRHLQQINTIMDANIELFFEFSQLNQQIISILKNNEQYDHFSDGQEKSLYQLQAANYIKRSKQYLEHSQEGQLKILQALQIVLSDDGINPQQLLKPKYLSITTELIEIITDIYQDNYQLTDTEEFILFIQTLYNICLSTSIAIKKLSQLSKITLVLPYYLEIAITILKQGSDSQIIDLLDSLETSSIAENSFIELTTIDKRVLKYSENSPMQSQIGHLFFIMPYINGHIMHQSEEIRTRIVQVMDKISLYITQQ